MGIRSFFSRYYKDVCGIDLRTLAFFRVGLAVSILLVLYSYLPDMYAIFDDRGLYPRRSKMSYGFSFNWSLYYVSGHVLWAYILFGLTALSALALLIGYRTRIALVLCWVLLLSLSVRTSAFINGGDKFLGIILFWGMFLPLGARFSVDAALCRKPPTSNRYVSIVTIALLLQVTYVYFLGALRKTGSLWQ